PYAVILEYLRVCNGDMVFCVFPLLDRQVVVGQVDVQIRVDQLVLDELPDDAGHLVAVELDDGSLDLDLRHERGRSSQRRFCGLSSLTVQAYWYTGDRSQRTLAGP